MIGLTALAILALLTSTQSESVEPILTPAEQSVQTSKVRFVPASIFLGRIDSCAINPPLSLVTDNAREDERDGNYVLQPMRSDGGSATLIAIAGGGQHDTELTAFVVDVLDVSPEQLRSTTGDAWKVFGSSTTVSGTQLIARNTDYSVCRVSQQDVPKEFPLGVTTTSSSAIQGALISAATVNILGIPAGSYVRLRLTSSPAGAEIFVDNIRQQPRTNTVLDVIAAAIPLLRIEKQGFEPCSVRHGNLTLNRASKRDVNANCVLAPSKRPRQ